MNMFDYCERLDPSFWAEPLNAITNVFFLVSAYYSYKYVHKKRVDKGVFMPVYLLLFLLVCIGIGSFLWHSFAKGWSELADVIPITLFIYAYLYFFIVKGLNKPWYFGLLSLILFTVFNYVIGETFDARTLNGSIAYIPALLSLFILAYFLKDERELPLMFTAIFLFLLSLFFRSIDFLVCDILSMGTHFLWHTLNALMLYILVKLLILRNRLS